MIKKSNPYMRIGIMGLVIGLILGTFLGFVLGIDFTVDRSMRFFDGALQGTTFNIDINETQIVEETYKQFNETILPELKRSSNISEVNQ